MSINIKMKNCKVCNIELNDENRYGKHLCCQKCKTKMHRMYYKKNKKKNHTKKVGRPKINTPGNIFQYDDIKNKIEKLFSPEAINQHKRTYKRIIINL